MNLVIVFKAINVDYLFRDFLSHSLFARGSLLTP